MNRCGFCVSGTESFRHVDPYKFAQWVAANNQPHIKSLTMPDPTPNFSKKRFHDLLDGLIDVNNQLTGSCAAVIENMDEEILDKFRAANMFTFFVGADSWSSTLRERICKKPTDPQRNMEILEYAVKKGITIYLSWISCMPTETREEFESDWEYKLKIAEKYASHQVWQCNTVCLILPGAPFHQNTEKYGITIEYWENPNKNLPEFDEIISRMSKIATYEEPVFEEILYRLSVIKKHCYFASDSSEFVIKGVDYVES
jgi:radical SAM superfamily enzyme YgiQ (UPF0313 family)